MLASVDLDQHFMERALALAVSGIGLASPNPQVGCVLVAAPAPGSSAPRILGEGTHLYAARDHAEIAALQQAARLGNDVHGATAFVTLEPCSHHGRTGPCADALIAAGISRCVVATADPNPLVSGEGLRRLRAAGIAVTVGVCQAAARALNLPFAWSIQHGRPLVMLKAALSVDGYLAPPPDGRVPGETFWLTGAEARTSVHQLRHAADALLTGIGTVLADDPALTDRSGLPRRRPLLRVILDPQLRTPPASQLLRSAAAQPSASAVDLLLVASTEALPERERELLHAAANHVEILRLPAGPAGRLSLPAVLALLAERQCLSVLLEAGPGLNSAFLHEDLADRVDLFFAETELGAGSVPFASPGPSPFVLQQHLQRASNTTVGRDVWVSGLLHDPWAALP